MVIGIITLIAGIVSIILPETKGKKLPDTLAEVEQLKYSNKRIHLYERLSPNLLEDETDDLLAK